MHIPEPEHFTTPNPIVAIHPSPRPVPRSLRQASHWRAVRMVQLVHLIAGGLLAVLSVSWQRDQSLNGWWKTTRTLKDGTVAPLLFEFKESNGRISGTARFDWGDLAIQNGLIQGERLSFSAGSSFYFAGARSSHGIALQLHSKQ